MKIEIITDGPWIKQIYKDGKKLNKKEANKFYGYLANYMNTTQYEVEK